MCKMCGAAAADSARSIPVDKLSAPRLSRSRPCRACCRQPDKGAGRTPSMIRATDIRHDLSGVRAAVERVRPLLDARGQLSITSRPGAREPLTDALGWLAGDARESDYSVINKEFRG